MTDWIAVLLEEQQEQEPEECLPELQAGEKKVIRQVEQEPEERETQDSLNYALTEEWPKLTDEARLEQMLERGIETVKSRMPENGSVPEQAGSVVEQGARLLWRRLVRGESALERRMAVQPSAEPEVRETGLKAGELDRMVERDARRYDGGFCLY